MIAFSASKGLKNDSKISKPIVLNVDTRGRRTETDLHALNGNLLY